MEIWQVLVLAIVEGVTEYLPISSTAHLILGSMWVGVGQTEFSKSFEIAVQMGAILAVVTLYLRKVWGNWPGIGKILISVTPTMAIGYLGYGLVKGVLLSTPWVAIAALGLGGVGILLVEDKIETRGDASWEKLSWRKCVVIGLLQAVALIPGVSRAAAAIYGGRAVGLSRAAAVEFSFLLAVPTILAAAGFDLYKSWGTFSASEIVTMFWGILLAWVSAMVVVKWLIGYVQRHNMKVFGWYRLVVAGVWAAWLGSI